MRTLRQVIMESGMGSGDAIWVASFVRDWLKEIIINADHKYEGEELRHAFNHIKRDLLKAIK